MIYVQDPDFTLHVGDVRDVLRELPDESVDCVVTSPPYWGLRDYGTEGQLGLETTPEEYVTNMVEVFREVRRVLASHGNAFVNMGDSYGPGKQLAGVPWKLAFALQDDGWILRSDIIWSKPNPMPESVTDRPTKAHEYVFLLTKNPRYYYDAEAIREPHNDRAGDVSRFGALGKNGGYVESERTALGGVRSTAIAKPGTVREYNPAGRNCRSVWEIPTQPYPEAHFATYPEALVERCLKAGCPEQVCRVCGKPRERIVEREFVKLAQRRDTRKAVQPGADMADINSGNQMGYNRTETLGFTDCGHSDYRPGIVLDPFMGSGTTALVARRLGRASVGIELSPEYAELCAKRLSQLSLLAAGAA